MTSPKILTLDIETSPNLAHVWSLWNQNISLAQLMESGEVIGFGAKWKHEPEKIFFHSNFHDGHRVMVEEAWEFLDEADIVIHFNGSKFDIPHLNTEFWKAGFEPPSAFQEIDLFKVIKSRFWLPSYKLQYASTFIGLPGKVQHEGHSLWVKCLQNDPEAWESMKKYCCQDVRVTEQLYDKLVPWISKHPNLGLYASDELMHCPNCSSTELTKNGFRYLASRTYQRYRCTSCGKESRSTKSVSSTDVVGV